MMIRDFSTSTFTGSRKVRGRMAAARVQRRSQLGTVAWLVVGVMLVGVTMSLGCGWLIRTTEVELVTSRAEHLQLSKDHQSLIEERALVVKTEATAAAAKLGLFPPAAKQIRQM